ncbi:hypothetical protein Tco_0615723 [Tanacetum coccineum]
MLCVKHIHENMKSQFKGGVYKDMLWNAARATTVVEFNTKLCQLKSYNSATYDWLVKIPEMDDPNIIIEEYIQLMADKAHKRGQMFDWETATYCKIYDDIDLFKDFEADFPAIVYNDALASDPEVSSEPTVSPHNAIKADFDFTISFSESDDEDYTFIYDKNSSSYKLISVNDLKSDTGNDIDEINVKLPSEDISIKPLDSVINVNVDTYSQEFDKTIETNHDTPVHVFPADSLYGVSNLKGYGVLIVWTSQYGVS